MHTVRVEQNDDYDAMVQKYQRLKIDCFNKLLKRHKLSKSARVKIIEELMFEEGSFFDGGWIAHKKGRVYATLGFAERPLDSSDGLGEVSKLYLSTNPSGIHEYAGASVQTYFEDHSESVKGIKAGVI